MPIYDFECQDCGHTSEVLVREAEQVVKCLHCGGSNLGKKVSAAHTVRSASKSPGTTCCGRAERCEAPPCSDGRRCQGH
jgi:putative FmdB family regulatory protein